MINVTYEEYNDLIFKLADKVRDYDPTTIVCISRGGLYLGNALSIILKKPLAVISATSYNNNTQNNLVISKYIAHTSPIGNKILLVDDMSDTGVTLLAVRKKLLDELLNIDYLLTATIWVKPKTTYIPTFYVSMLETEEWIVQPFETFDK